MDRIWIDIQSVKSDSRTPLVETQLRPWHELLYTLANTSLYWYLILLSYLTNSYFSINLIYFFYLLLWKIKKYFLFYFFSLICSVSLYLSLSLTNDFPHQQAPSSSSLHYHRQLELQNAVFFDKAATPTLFSKDSFVHVNILLSSETV